MHTRCSGFSAILSATTTQTLPFFIRGGMTMRKARPSVASADRSRYIRTRCHIRVKIAVRIFFKQSSYVQTQRTLDKIMVLIFYIVPYILSKYLVRENIAATDLFLSFGCWYFNVHRHSRPIA